MNTTRTPELLDDVEFLGVARLDGRLVNVYSDGTLLPVICGGSSDADSGDTTSGDTTAGDNTSGDTTAASSDSGDTDNDGGGESEDDEDTVVLSRSEWEKTRERLRRANKEAARRRAWLEEHGIDPRTGKPKPRPTLDDSDDEPPLPKPKAKQDEEASSASEAVDVQALQERWQKLTQREVEKAATRAEMKYKRPLARAAAEAALARAGWSGKDLSKVMKLIDIDDIDLDDDGNVIGVEEQVEDLKEEFPEWFRRPRVSSRKPAASSSGKSTKDVGGADKPPVDTKPKDWKRRLAESALKK